MAERPKKHTVTVYHTDHGPTEMFPVDAGEALARHPDEWSDLPWTRESAEEARGRRKARDEKRKREEEQKAKGDRPAYEWPSEDEYERDDAARRRRKNAEVYQRQLVETRRAQATDGMGEPRRESLSGAMVSDAEFRGEEDLRGSDNSLNPTFDPKQIDPAPAPNSDEAAAEGKIDGEAEEENEEAKSGKRRGKKD